ncbi:hypothetical protein AeMF1_013707 [Aphanomyces euteiches]|nr:hypothetical protein AeMF1_013707 [Aphanomyces euteiches]KAH9194670.1 hypothetical protein AeNC1_003344 [Aphanomyces euteiches]
MEEGDCVVCLDPLVQDLRAAPCGHVFHSKCISSAIEARPNCPQCRRKTRPSDLIRLFFRVPAVATTGPSPEKSKNDKKVELLKKALNQHQEELDTARNKLDEWEAYDVKVRSAYTQLESKANELKKDKERLQNEVQLMKSTVELMNKKRKSDEIDEATLTFLRSHDAEALEKELQNPAHIIIALKKANKFRQEQYTKVLKKLQERSKENTIVDVIAPKQREKKLKRALPKTLPPFDLTIRKQTVQPPAPAAPTVVIPKTLSFVERTDLKPIIDLTMSNSTASRPIKPKAFRSTSITSWLA